VVVDVDNDLGEEEDTLVAVRIQIHPVGLPYMVHRFDYYYYYYYCHDNFSIVEVVDWDLP